MQICLTCDDSLIKLAHIIYLNGTDEIKRGEFTMELAKETSKGQVTITVEIRRKLGIKNGDKLLFIEESGRIYMMNSSMDALREAQRAFAGEAERLGLKNDDDVMAMIKELREESIDIEKPEIMALAEFMEKFKVSEMI